MHHTGIRGRFSWWLGPMACWGRPWNWALAIGHHALQPAWERRCCGGCHDTSNIWQGGGREIVVTILALESLHKCDVSLSKIRLVRDEVIASRMKTETMLVLCVPSKKLS